MVDEELSLAAGASGQEDVATDETENTGDADETGDRWAVEVDGPAHYFKVRENAYRGTSLIRNRTPP